MILPTSSDDYEQREATMHYSSPAQQCAVYLIAGCTLSYLLAFTRQCGAKRYLPRITLARVKRAPRGAHKNTFFSIKNGLFGSWSLFDFDDANCRLRMSVRVPRRAGRSGMDHGMNGIEEFMMTGTTHGLSSEIEKNPVLQLPLSQVMRPEIALTLQHVLQLFTVGSFLNAWRNPKNHKNIEQLFDTPQQARHAAAVCATWLGVQSNISHAVAGAWWAENDRQIADA